MFVIPSDQCVSLISGDDESANEMCISDQKRMAMKDPQWNIQV